MAGKLRVIAWSAALLAGTVLAANGQTPAPSAQDIMRKVAENQDREQKARSEFVYEETVRRAVRTKNGRLRQEEFRTYAVTPTANGVTKHLKSVRGRVWRKGVYVNYDGQEPPRGGLVSIVFDDDEEGDSRNKDGVDKDLFPLTSEEQKKYVFELLGERTVQERPAFRIEFRPNDRKDYGWSGEALIDKEEFQPVTVYTRLSRKLPMAVRTMLGTDVPGLGFNIQYKRVDKDLWFPASYGTEFGVHALFLLKWSFSESAENKNFRRTSVESRIQFGEGPNTDH